MNVALKGRSSGAATTTKRAQRQRAGSCGMCDVIEHVSVVYLGDFGLTDIVVAGCRVRRGVGA